MLFKNSKTEYIRTWKSMSFYLKWFWMQRCELLNITNYMACAHSMDFEYLSDVPVLTLDVNDDFKQNDSKSADMIEKVSKGS